MAISGISVPKGIAGTASECLRHAIETFGRDAVKTALVCFAELNPGEVGSWLAGDIRPSSKSTPMLYVALDLLSYDVQEFKALDNKRRTILQAYAFGGIEAEELAEELCVKKWPKIWPLLLDTGQTSLDDKLTELAGELEEAVKAETTLQAERLKLHTLALYMQEHLMREERPEKTERPTRPAHPINESTDLSTPNPSVQAEDPRFASVAARLIETLLATLAMGPNREQLIARSRDGRNLKDLVEMLKHILAPHTVTDEASPSETAITPEVTQS